jgi:3'-5' exoribonuclease
LAGEQFVENLIHGIAVRARFCVVGAQPASGNGPHRFILRDRTGDIRAKSWPNRIAWEALAAVTYADVEGTVTEYQGNLDVQVDRLTSVSDPGDLSEFLPASPRDSAQMWEELKELVRTIQDVPLRTLLGNLFSDAAFRKAYLSAPAAQKMHHPYLAGLLEHSLEVALLCDAVAAAMPNLHRDLLVTAALLHDVGKVEEIDATGPQFAFTRTGGLLGHVFLGAQRIYAALQRIEGCPPDLADALCHLLLSHQGKLEWGSPVTPGCFEAYVLHACDQLSAQGYYCRQGATVPGVLFQRVPGLEGYLYTRPLSSPVAARAGKRKKVEAPPPIRFSETEPPTIIVLPILGRIAAGQPTDVQQEVEGHYSMARTEAVRDGDFLLRVRGDSMIGAAILDGDLVHVRPQQQARPGEIVVALVDHESTLKRLVRENGRLLLRAENTAYPDIVPQADLCIQGKVIGVIRTTT